MKEGSRKKEGSRPQTGKEALQWAAYFLAGSGYRREQALREGTLLLSAACGQDKLQVLTNQDKPLTDGQWQEFAGFVRRRSEWEPLQYILEVQEFMALTFKVTPAVLIPRSDTETLVEEGLRLARATKEPHILDVGTGSGAVALSLAHYLSEARVYASDISASALETARENARRLRLTKRVSFYLGDLFASLPAVSAFDLIVSNPPYISASEMSRLPWDVKREPISALYGGEDGLLFYRRLIPEALNYLKAEGWLLLEIGWQQGTAVKEMLAQHGYKGVRIIQDLSGRDRVTAGQKK